MSAWILTDIDKLNNADLKFQADRKHTVPYHNNVMRGLFVIDQILMVQIVDDK